jgi:hypothetical protein
MSNISNEIPPNEIVEECFGYKGREYKYGGLIYGLVVKLKEGHRCKSCNSELGFIYPRDPHFRLDCGGCSRYIKFPTQTPWLVEKMQPCVDALLCEGLE